MTGNPKPSETPKRKPTAEEQSDLDHALEDTFPASDPTSVGHATGDDTPSAPVDRKPPLIDRDLVKRLAEQLRERKT